MMTHNEIRKQLPDYTLNLLSPGQLGLIEQHVAHCTSCRQTVLHERKIGRLVQTTINIAAQPDSRHLRTLMPKPPQKRRSRWTRHGWQRQLAPVMLILVLLLGVFLTQKALPSGSLPAFVTTAHAATATSTNTPTATAVQTLSQKQDRPLRSRKTSEVFDTMFDTKSKPNNLSIPAPSSGPHHPVTTPDPLPTPVASVMQLFVQ